MKNIKSKVPYVCHDDDGIIVKIGRSKITLNLSQHCEFVDKLRKECDRFTAKKQSKVEANKE